MSIATPLKSVIAEVSAEFLERGEVIEAVVMAMLAKEHAFILGPPGTGKSAMTREIFSRIQGADYFEAILSKTRPAEAILGPYDIPELRDHGHLHRKINGFLPTCNFAFLDEIGKMSPTLGHDLLSVVLERRLHQVNGGRSWVEVPLYTFIGASNELMVEESEDAAALWDRMLVRTYVDYLRESSSLASLLQGRNAAAGGVRTEIPFADFKQAVDVDVPDVRIPQDVIDAVLDLREKLRAEEIVPSDRRWKASMKLIKASAYLNDRSEATTDDMSALRFSLWDVITQVKTVERLTLSVSNPIAEAVMALMDDIKAIRTEAETKKGLSSEVRGAYVTETNGKLRTIASEIQKKRQECVAMNRSTDAIDKVEAELQAVKKKLYVELLEIDPAMMP